MPRRDDPHRPRAVGARPTDNGGARVHSRFSLPVRLRLLPAINFGGQPRVRRAAYGSVKDLPSAIRDRGSSICNNSDHTARVYARARASSCRCGTPRLGTVDKGRWRAPAAAAWRPSASRVQAPQPHLARSLRLHGLFSDRRWGSARLRAPDSPALDEDGSQE
ncbi:hypothetical protein E7X58_37735 [Streptomyces sp. A1499]|nr:hypothetical protein E7X58_37735 [Streptomyces sp. A1499]